MSHSIRFLGFAVLAWAGVRAASLGLLPGTSAMAADAPMPPPAALPAIVPTRLEPEGLFDPPPAPAPDQPMDAAGDAAPPPRYYTPAPIYAAYAAAPRHAPAPRYASIALDPRPVPFAEAGAIALSPARAPARQSQVSPAPDARRSVPTFLARRLDRLQLSAWAMMRQDPAAPGLAASGTLGGSQAGARLDYRLSRRLSATLRLSSAAQGPRGAEVAPGVRWRPLDGVPLSLIAERRQAIGRHGGTSGFALLAEGGFYDLAGPLDVRLDGYAQAGVVGLRQPTPFVDGAFAATRPLWGRVAAGVGLWGGAQPGLWRIDAGPRVTLPVGRAMRLHVDWRQRLAGNAGPGSGAVATVAADF